MINNNSGFWTGGPNALLAGLKEEYGGKVAKLQKKLKKAESDEERHRIADELDQIRETYGEQFKRVGENIF